LTAKPLGNHTSANPFTGCVDSRCSTRRTTAHHQHVERVFLGNLFCLALFRTAVEPLDDFIQRHTALSEGLAVQVYGRDRHNLALVDLVLEQGSIDHYMANVGVKHRHQVQRLDYLRSEEHTSELQ